MAVLRDRRQDPGAAVHRVGAEVVGGGLTTTCQPSCTYWQPLSITAGDATLPSNSRGRYSRSHCRVLWIGDPVQSAAAQKNAYREFESG